MTADRRTVVQIAPEIGPGSGVAAVAHHLERAFQDQGRPTRRVTLQEVGGGWLPQPGPGLRGKAVLAARVTWFSTVGTVCARRILAAEPDAVSITHNDALAGDVYVNHGVVRAAMAARGNATWRMLRNPLHAFTFVRDAYRFGRGVHPVVVNLTDTEDGILRSTYPRVASRTAVIGNGVDTKDLRPASSGERRAAREALGLVDTDLLALFVGHEFERKGLPLVLEALSGTADSIHLLVVGGTPDMVEAVRAQVRALGIEARVHLTGRVSDPRPSFYAADVLVFPSAYEAYPLVVLESLAHGVPVVATAVGSVPDLIQDGVNGFVIEPRASTVRDRLVELAHLTPSDQGRFSEAARATALEHDWAEVALRYGELLDDIAPIRRPRSLIRPGRA